MVEVYCENLYIYVSIERKSILDIEKAIFLHIFGQYVVEHCFGYISNTNMYIKGITLYLYIISNNILRKY